MHVLAWTQSKNRFCRIVFGCNFISRLFQ